MASKHTRLENQILHFTKNQKWDRVEALWPQLAEDPPADPKFYATVAARVVESEKTDDLRAWVMLVVDACATMEDPKTLVQVCRGVLHVLPEFEELRQPLIDALRNSYGKHRRLEEFLDQSGLLHETSLYKPLNRFLQYISFSEGEVFQHGDWGVGVVIRLDATEERAAIRFADGAEKAFSFDGVREFLKRIPRSHFLAQRILNPQGLARRARQSPVEFAKFCLKGLGGSVSRSDLKEALIGHVFDARAWTSWWNANRDKLRLDPYIGYSGAPSNPRLELRTEPKSFHEEMAREFERAETMARQSAIVADILKMRDSEPIPEEVARRLLTSLRMKIEATGAENLPARLDYLCLGEDLAAALPESNGEVAALDGSLQQALETVQDPTDFVTAMMVPDYQVRVCEHFRKLKPGQWSHHRENLFLNAPPRLGQWLLRETREGEGPATAAHMVEQLLHRPLQNPELFIWIVRTMREGKLGDLPVDAPAEMVLDSALELIGYCHERVTREEEDATAARGIRSRVQNLLMASHHGLVVDAFESMEAEDARARYRQMMGNPALNDSFRISLDHALRAARSDLDEPGDEVEQGGEIFVTAESYKEKQEEYFRLKNEEIPANSKAIGEAAAQGDLSENAEYESAKERQKVLFRRLEALEDLLHRCRVLDPERINTDVISCGTAFVVRNLTNGSDETYRLLGIWDADPEKNILSYQTPFGRQFLNRKIGEEIMVERPGGGSTRYQVKSIENALAPE